MHNFNGDNKIRDVVVKIYYFYYFRKFFLLTNIWFDFFGQIVELVFQPVSLILRQGSIIFNSKSLRQRR